MEKTCKGLKTPTGFSWRIVLYFRKQSEGWDVDVKNDRGACLATSWQAALEGVACQIMDLAGCNSGRTRYWKKILHFPKLAKWKFRVHVRSQTAIEVLSCDLGQGNNANVQNRNKKHCSMFQKNSETQGSMEGLINSADNLTKDKEKDKTACTYPGWGVDETQVELMREENTRRNQS